MRLPPVLALAGCVIGLSACAASPHDQVQAKVEQFARATAKRDYGTICRQVLAPSLLTRLSESGIPCLQAMEIALGSVRKPTLAIGSVSVRGSSAAVIVLTSAQGQRSAVSEIKLVRTGAGWRVSALGSPVGARFSKG